MKRLLFGLPTLLILSTIGLMLMHGPIPQLENYHAFADQSMLLGLPHAAAP